MTRDRLAMPICSASLALGLLLAMAGCGPSKPKMLSSPIEGYNHTSASINYFTVNGAAGPNIGPHQGGGKQSCCGMLPRLWYPGLKVVVEWVKDPNPRDADHWPEPIFSEGWAKRMAEHRTRYTHHRAEVEIPYYEKSCGIQAHFLPCDQVQVNTTCVPWWNPDYPYKELLGVEEPKECPAP